MTRLLRAGALAAGMCAALLGAGCKRSDDAPSDGAKAGGVAGGAAADLAGSYTIASASNPGSASGYKGTVEITKAGDAYKIAWSIPGSPAYGGVAIASGSVLGVGWGMGARYGVAVYRVDGGKLHGQWATASSGAKLGTEELDGPAGLSGRYQIASGRSADGKSYTGSVTIQPTGDTYSVSWALPTDSYSGVGILEGDRLVVGWGEAGKGAGAVSYRVGDKELSGRWATPGGTKLGAEVLRRN